MALHRSSLAAAISMAISSGLMISAGAQAEGYVGDSFADMMDNSGINLELRNFYFNRDFRDKQWDDPETKSERNPGLRESWAQGARLNLESGYFMDMIGIDASWYGSLKLHGSDSEWGSDALRAGSEKYKVKNGITYIERKQESYDKLGQVFLKAKFGGDDLNANIKAGRMFLDTPLLNDSDSRVTPSTTQAIYADVKMAGFTVYGFSSDKASTKTQTGFDKYEGDSYTYASDGDEIKETKGKKGDWKVNSIGVGYDTGEGYGVHLQLARADDYKKQDYLNAFYTVYMGEDTSLLFDGYYQKGKGDGKYYPKVNHAKKGKYEDWDSELWNVVAQLTISDLKLALSFQQVDGDYYDYMWGGSDDNGLMQWNAVQYHDFNRGEEDSWMARIDYDFAGMGMPGLNFMTRYVKGEYEEHVEIDTNKFIKKTRNEWERDTDISYAFQDGALKGLTITWRNATFRTYDSDSLNENRLIVDYSIALL